MNDRSDELSTADLAGQRPGGDERRADEDRPAGATTADDRVPADQVVDRDRDLDAEGRTADEGFADDSRTDGGVADDRGADGGFAGSGRTDGVFADSGRTDDGFADDRRAADATAGDRLSADERAANAEAAGLGTTDDRPVDGGAVDGGLSDDRPADDLPAGDPYAGGTDRERGPDDADVITDTTPAAAPTPATPAGTNLTAPTGTGATGTGPTGTGPTGTGPTGTGATGSGAGEGSTTESGAPTGVDGPLMPAGDSEGFRARWTDVQTGFVDEPRRAVEQADALVAELMQQLAKTFADERTRLEAQWDSGDDVATDDLRTAFQRYRSFFERLLST